MVFGCGSAYNTWWYWVRIGWYRLVFGGSGSVVGVSGSRGSEDDGTGSRLQFKVCDRNTNTSVKDELNKYQKEDLNELNVEANDFGKV